MEILLSCKTLVYVQQAKLLQFDNYIFRGRCVYTGSGRHDKVCRQDGGTSEGLRRLAEHVDSKQKGSDMVEENQLRLRSIKLR
jgi:hypothetical protein